MRIDPAGWPFVLGALVLAIIAAFAAGLPFGIALLVLTVFFLFFFRDPDRAVTVPAGTVVTVAPATGVPAQSRTSSPIRPLSSAWVTPVTIGNRPKVPSLMNSSGAWSVLVASGNGG